MKTLKICAFGDSVMKGTVLESREPLRYTLPEKSFCELSAEKLGISIDNFARFGSTVSMGEKNLIRHMAGISQYDYTLLKFGGNDCDYYWSAIAAEPARGHKPNTPLTEFILTYTRMVNMVRTLGSTPIILSMVPVEPLRYFMHVTRDFPESGRQNVLQWLGGTPNFISEWHDMYNIQLMSLAARLGVPTIDITSLFYSRPGYGALLCEDGAHPNLEGQRLMAGVLAEELGKLTAADLPLPDGLQPAFC